MGTGGGRLEGNTPSSEEDALTSAGRKAGPGEGMQLNVVTEQGSGFTEQQKEHKTEKVWGPHVPQGELTQNH